MIRSLPTLVCAAALAVAQPPMPEVPSRTGPPMPRRPPNGLPATTIDPAQRLSFMAGVLASQMSLTAEQQSQMKTLVGQATEDAKPLQTDLRRNREAIRDAIKGGKGKSVLDPLLKASGALHSKLAALEAKTYTSFCAMLTPDQIANSNNAFSMISFVLESEHGGAPVTPPLGTPFPGARPRQN